MSEKLEMKKCKECGKMFVPRHKRQVYCDDVHYRPCPVCGKPVEAKYLSDPARVCSAECRKVLSQKTKEKSTPRSAKTIETKPTNLKDQLVVNENKIAESGEAVPYSEQISKSADIVRKCLDDICSENGLESPSEYAQYLREHSKVKRYEGKAVLGFIPGHEYSVDVDKVDQVYNVTALYDFTAGKSVDLMMPVSSKISFYRSFKSVDK